MHGEKRRSDVGIHDNNNKTKDGQMKERWWGFSSGGPLTPTSFQMCLNGPLRPHSHSLAEQDECSCAPGTHGRHPEWRTGCVLLQDPSTTKESGGSPWLRGPGGWMGEGGGCPLCPPPRYASDAIANFSDVFIAQMSVRHFMIFSVVYLVGCDD